MKTFNREYSFIRLQFYGEQRLKIVLTFHERERKKEFKTKALTFSSKIENIKLVGALWKLTELAKIISFSLKRKKKENKRERLLNKRVLRNSLKKRWVDSRKIGTRIHCFNEKKKADKKKRMILSTSNIESSFVHNLSTKCLRNNWFDIAKKRRLAMSKCTHK